nr:2-succinyl-5-enolpyruvyl-6-hydroxy-3-cyclohexene-1-carboxylic-acid synthase [Salsipaludibacter albus]
MVDELVRVGVRHVVVSPGSRSTALALAVAARDELTVHVRHDERSVGFVALGVGRVTGIPAAVVTTSGTAVANLAPAVVEADAAGVPLLLLTADRPVELHEVGANQTIRQADLFGERLRWAMHLPAPGGHAGEPATWRTTVDRAVAAATGIAGSGSSGTGGPAGPVHLDVAFREPTVPGLDDGRSRTEAYPHPATGRAGGRPWTTWSTPPAEVDVSDLAARLAGRRVLVVAGDGPRPIGGLATLGERGWPVVAEPTAGPRHGVGLTHGTALLGAGGWLSGDARPDVVLRLGRPTLARPVHHDLADVETIQVTTSGVVDPSRAATSAVVADPDAVVIGLLAAAPEPPPPGWTAAWTRAADVATGLVEEVLGSGDAAASAPAVMGSVAVAAGSRPLVVASSLPIRDLDAWVARTDARVHANRGVAGIDGFTSTAVGVAVASGPTVAVAGDLSFLHDHNGLLVDDPATVPLTLVVVDNDGGGLFHHVPAVRTAGFERLFATPHGRDLVTVAAATGVEAASVAPGDLSAAVTRSDGGLRVLVVRTDRHADAAVRGDLARELAVRLGD